MKRLNKGDRLRGIPGDDWNRFIDTAELVQGREPAFSSKAGTFIGRDACIVPVKNTTGSDVARFGIVGISGILFGPDDNLNEFKSNFALEGDVPEEGKHEGKFAVYLEPCPAGKVRRAVVSGVTVCRLDATAEGDTHAEIAGGDIDKLKSGPTGSARILWKEPGLTLGSGTGKWAVVRLGEGAGEMVVVQIIANGTGGGKYAGRILTGDSTAADAADLAMPEGMTAPDANDCLVLNTDEDGLPTHWLALNSYAVGVRKGMTDESTPKAIVVIPRGVPRMAEPTEIGAGATGTTTARTTYFERNAVTAGDLKGDCPTKVWYLTRVILNKDGAEPILQQFFQYDLRDASGRTYYTSAESGPTTINAPVDCTAV